MKYQANPVIVEALRIEEVMGTLPSGHTGLVLEDNGWHLATQEQTARMKPVVGDYVVTQEDGYVYLNPRDVFQRKYSPVTIGVTA